MRERFRRFMAGRYGNDQFGRFLCVAALAILLLNILWRGWLYYVGLGLLIYYDIRYFSRNRSKREAENRWYLQKREAVRRWAQQARQRFAMRRTYRYFRCPNCRRELRVPRGRGRISICCPQCGVQFIRRS